ncbi:MULTISPECIES: helix-turn-helix transcriptional regulator [Bifidobacterium]|uniref:helix-turn-helix transcriptional regulator n=1 Tax=Bifidobacterium TaxID=1678 RepID=UPI001BDD9A9F|nr:MULTISPECIES: helix-turn-helix transcriptional regulator [Bifidobacterium]MBT1160347.1 helix-turn-helix transcriptional regulator [Bifidobacterium sp. SO1]MBW3079248.1 helix-turn-helix transcriptional regulator [Bifidobacterium simiiventris]
MTFRTNLQALRARRNMTQEQLAMLLGVSRQAISKWESEKAYPEMDKLLAICDLFGCTLDDLVLGDVTRADDTGDAGDAADMVDAADWSASLPTAEGDRSDSDGHGGNRPVGCDGIDAASVRTQDPAIPQDPTGYDAHRRRFALLIASGVTTVVASVGVANLFDPVNSIIGSSPFNDLLMFVCIGMGMVVGLALLIPGGMSHVVFARRHPYVEDPYTEDDRDREIRLLATGIVGGMVAILVGIVVVVYADDVLGIASGWPNAVMLLLSALAVFGFVYCGMRYGLLNIDAYNRAAENDRGEERRTGQQAFSNRLTVAVCGVIMLVATIIALCLLLLMPGADAGVWSAFTLFWLPWPVGGTLCGIAALVIWLCKDRLDG